MEPGFLPDRSGSHQGRGRLQRFGQGIADQRPGSIRKPDRQAQAFQKDRRIFKGYFDAPEIGERILRIHPREQKHPSGSAEQGKQLVQWESHRRVYIPVFKRLKQ